MPAKKTTPPPPPSVQDIAARFQSHKVDEEQGERINQLRSAFTSLAEHICEITKPGREQATALTHLETASFYAVAGIARENI